MLSAFGRVFKTADLRRKLLFTLAMIVLYRVGTFIPAPGVSYGNVQQCLNANVTSGGVYDIVNLFSGGALLQLSIFGVSSQLSAASACWSCSLWSTWSSPFAVSPCSTQSA